MPLPYSRIAIVGGGCSGLAAAKALASEPHKFTIDLFEKREQLGGIWNYDNDKSKFHPSVPSTSIKDKELIDEDHKGKHFLSPMYKQLETNLLGEVMEFKGVKFPADVPDFPSRVQVLEYILKYSKTIPAGVNYHLQTEVVSLQKHSDWEMSIRDPDGKIREGLHYDAVVIGNGHFDIPYIPDVPGLREWHQRDPESISHAKYYNDAEEFADQTVLVIGNYASGSDISTQISAHAKTVYISSRDPEDTLRIPNQRAQHVGLIKEYSFDTRSAQTEHLVIDGIDSVVFCTGYLYDVPFLKSYPDVITDGSQVNNIYKQIFYINDPSLAFVALSKFIVPMPFAESQAALIARVFSGRYSLPSKESMTGEYLRELQKKGTGKTFHNLKYPEDVEYCNELLSLLESQGSADGFVGYYWDDNKNYARTDKNKELKLARVAALVDVANQQRLDNEAKKDLK